MTKEERQKVLDSFDHLLIKFYAIVGRYSSKHPEKKEVEGLITVAWTSIQACGKQVTQAVKEGKSLTEVKLIIFRFEQQLDALDPLHAFVPGEKLSD